MLNRFRRLGSATSRRAASECEYDGEESCFANPEAGDPLTDPRDPVVVAAALHLLRVGMSPKEVRNLSPATLEEHEIEAACRASRSDEPTVVARAA